MQSKEGCSWSESAFYWEKHRKSIEQAYGPLTTAIIRFGEIQSGLNILDVAGGTGEPSLTIMESYRDMKITITDIEFEMIQSAKKESERRGHKNFTCCRCNGEQLPFGNEIFDRVVSRFGIMFFPNPVNGLREMLRVTRTNGRIVIAVWHEEEANPMFHLSTEILKRYFPPGPEQKEFENPFRFASAGSLTALAREAGGKNIQEAVLDFFAEAPITVEQYWSLRSEMSQRLREQLKRLSKEQYDSAMKDVMESVQPYFHQSHMKFPAKAVLMTCTK